MPLKWIIGGNEFDMSETAAQEAADAVASQLTPAQTAELLGKLATIDAGRPSQMTLAMADYVSFEQYAITRVAAAASEVGWTFASWEYDFGVDNRAAFQQAYQVYHSRYRHLFKASPEAQKERTGFLHFCGTHDLTSEGRLFLTLFRAKGMVRRCFGRNPS